MCSQANTHTSPHTHPCRLILGDICSSLGHWQRELYQAIKHHHSNCIPLPPPTNSSHPGIVLDVIGLIPPGRSVGNSGAFCFLAMSAMAVSLWAGSEKHIKGTFGAFWHETVSIRQLHPCCVCLKRREIFMAVNLIGRVRHTYRRHLLSVCLYIWLRHSYLTN